MIEFGLTKKDAMKIALAVERFKNILKSMGNPKGIDLFEVEMDLAACHLNGCRLDLAKLIAFDDFNFAHDVFGIHDHMDRQTGKLVGQFLPRCSREG